jgi:hypothetical protein
MHFNTMAGAESFSSIPLTPLAIARLLSSELTCPLSKPVRNIGWSSTMNNLAVGISPVFDNDLHSKTIGFRLYRQLPVHFGNALTQAFGQGLR